MLKPEQLCLFFLGEALGQSLTGIVMRFNTLCGAVHINGLLIRVHRHREAHSDMHEDSHTVFMCINLVHTCIHRTYKHLRTCTYTYIYTYSLSSDYARVLIVKVDGKS